MMMLAHWIKDSQKILSFWKILAEGEVQLIKLVAEAQVEATKVVSISANQYFQENAQLNKKLDVIRDTFAQQIKIVVPSTADILNVIG